MEKYENIQRGKKNISLLKKLKKASFFTNKKREENMSPKCRLRQVYFPISVQKSTNNPFWSPKGNLPVFRHNGIVLNDFPAVVKHLKSCNYSADYNLTNKQVKHWNKVFRWEGEVKER